MGISEYMFIKETVDLTILEKYGFMYNKDTREFMTDRPRWEYYEDKSKKGNKKPLIVIYDDSRVVCALYTTTYLFRYIPNVIMDLITDGLITKK